MRRVVLFLKCRDCGQVHEVEYPMLFCAYCGGVMHEMGRIER